METEPAKSGKMSWYQVMAQVYSQPSVESYQDVVSCQGIRFSRVYLWIFSSTLLAMLIPLVLYYATGGKIVHDDLKRTFLLGNAGMGIYFAAGVGTALLAPLIFMAGAGILHWLAQRLGGTGHFEPLVFLLGAVYAPGNFARPVAGRLHPAPRVGVGVSAGIASYHGISVHLERESRPPVELGQSRAGVCNPCADRRLSERVLPWLPAPWKVIGQS